MSSSYFWALLGYKTDSGSTEPKTTTTAGSDELFEVVGGRKEPEAVADELFEMLHKQHLLRRKSSSKRFVIGDEGEEEATAATMSDSAQDAVVANSTVADQPTGIEWLVKSKSHLKSRATLT